MSQTGLRAEFLHLLEHLVENDSSLEIWSLRIRYPSFYAPRNRHICFQEMWISPAHLLFVQKAASGPGIFSISSLELFISDQFPTLPVYPNLGFSERSHKRRAFENGKHQSCESMITRGTK